MRMLYPLVLLTLLPACGPKAAGAERLGGPPPIADGRGAVTPMTTPTDGASPTPVDPSQLVSHPSGLQFADLTVGDGPTSVEGQRVSVHYRGWLEDGTMFDSSIDRGKAPFAFLLERPGVIEGWHHGIRDMRLGGLRQLRIPPELAYGERGRPPTLPPNSTLIFEVELVALGEVRRIPQQPKLAFDTHRRAQQLSGGVRAIDVSRGVGLRAESGSTLTVEMTLWSERGELFFSTYQRERRVRFTLDSDSRVEAPPLEGLEIGMVGLAAGGQRYLSLPPEVAFGARGQPPQVAPNSTITALVEVLDVSPPRIPPERPPAFDAAGMLQTESGLRLLDLEVGTGQLARPGDTITAEYTGWLEDGTRFDSSLLRRDPFTVKLGMKRIIEGWEEGLQGMQEGGRRILVVPPELAYGGRDTGVIPANSTLTFEVEMVRIERE